MDVRVLTVDDQAVFRGIAHEVIDVTPGFESVGEAASGEEALAAVAELDPHLVLLDVRMPGLDGIEVARAYYMRHIPTWSWSLSRPRARWTCRRRRGSPNASRC